ATVGRSGHDGTDMMTSLRFGGAMELDREMVPDFCSKPVVVLGCGNLLWGDDGFGCELIAWVEQHCEIPEHVCILDAGTGVRKLLFTMCVSPIRPKRLVIVDAIDVNRTPGEVFEIDPASIPAAKLDDFSLHQIPTSNLLRELQEECGVEVRILACQTGALPDEISPGLSASVAAALGPAAELLVDEYFLPLAPAS
ncbi:MAG: hydrogenase maturation protease, partial [Thermoanaerobaculia bacterium]